MEQYQTTQTLTRTINMAVFISLIGELTLVSEPAVI